MGYNILETKEVERNGVSLTFVKSQGSGENSKASWKLKLAETELENLVTWIGKNAEVILAAGLNKIFWLWYNGNNVAGDDDKFFERLEADTLQGGSGGGRTRSASNKAIKERLESKGWSQEDIADLFA